MSLIHRYKKFLIIYTAVFSLLFIIVFSWYLFTDRTLIFRNDGLPQHYTALIYYGRYLRSIVKNLLFNHKSIIPDWDFNIGEGADILNTLHYYVFGDPLALFSVFVPSKYTYILYQVLVAVRLYLSGISFAALCFGTGKANNISICAGASAYSFCLWSILNATRHPYFLNPLIYLPLIILGIEKIIKGQKSTLMTVMIAIAAFSNFYFFYMIVLLVIIYSFVRVIILCKKNIVSAFKLLVSIALPSVCGTMIAGAILIPVLFTFLADSRMSLKHSFTLFYPLSYYSQFPAAILNGNSSYWIYLGLTAPAIIAVLLLFRTPKDKQQTLLKVLFIIGLIILMFPILGRAFNGFSYVTNRWCWALVLVSCYILVSKWDDLINLSNNYLKYLNICTIIIFSLCMLLDRSRTKQIFSIICLIFITLFMLSKTAGIKHIRTDILLLIMVCVSVCVTGYWKNAPDGDNYIGETVDADILKDNHYLTNETKAIKKAADGKITRFSGTDLTLNGGMLSKMNSTNFYWSISNPYVNKFRDDLEMREELLVLFEGYDDRTKLMTLASVDYYSSPTVQATTFNPNPIIPPVPYNFTHIGDYNVEEKRTKQQIKKLKKELKTDKLADEQIEKLKNISDNYYSIYKNNNTLPEGYCYNKYIPDSKWSSLNPAQKENVMLKAVYLSEIPDNCSELQKLPAENSLKYSVTCDCSPEIIFDNGKIITTSKNTYLTLSFSGVPKSETYIEFKGLEFEGTPEYDLYFGDESVDPLNLYNKTTWSLLESSAKNNFRRNKILWSDPLTVNISLRTPSGFSKTLTYAKEDYSFTSGRHNYMINMGYNEAPLNSVTIYFPLIGVYSFDSLNVLYSSFETYEKDINALKKNTLKNVKYGVDELSGNINLKKPAFMCLTVSYQKGWKAYVDGTEAPIYIANERYLGLDLPEGKHEIKLKYSNPYKYKGLVISLAGLIIFAVNSIIKKRKGTCKT